MKNINFIFSLLVVLLSIPSVCYARGGDGGILAPFIAIFIFFSILSAILGLIDKHPATSLLIIISLIMFILIKKFAY